MKKLNSHSVLVSIITLTIVSCSTSKQTTTLTCGDGRQVISYKNPEQRYPDFVKSNENKFQGTISILDKIKLDMDRYTKSTVTNLRDILNNENYQIGFIAKSSSILPYNSFA